MLISYLFYLLLLLSPVWFFSRKYGFYKDKRYFAFALIYAFLFLLLLISSCYIEVKVDEACTKNETKNIFPDYDKHVYWSNHAESLNILVHMNIVFVWGLFIITKLKFLNKRYFKLSYFIATMIIFFASIAFHFI